MPDNNAAAVAHIVHQSDGRLRLRIPERRGDLAYFNDIALKLADCPGVRRAEGRAATSGVLILHERRVDPRAIADFAAEAGLFFLDEPPRRYSRTLRDYATAGIGAVDRSLVEASGGLVDLDSALMMTLLAMALRQALRGQVVGPGLTLAWYAFGLAAPRRRGPSSS